MHGGAYRKISTSTIVGYIGECCVESYLQVRKLRYSCKGASRAIVAQAKVKHDSRCVTVEEMRQASIALALWRFVGFAPLELPA